MKALRLMDKCLPWAAKKALVISGLVRIRQKPINGNESLRYVEYGPSLIFKNISKTKQTNNNNNKNRNLVRFKTLQHFREKLQVQL